MIHLVLICFGQSILSVGGSILLRSAFQSAALTLPSIMQACFSMRGIGGIASMILSFVILVYGLSQYRPNVIIPVNTATTFLIAIVLAYFLDNHRYSLLALGGMAMIVLGIVIVSKAQ